jgi:FlaA1/EpsC-like NDP-sugar epimerase
MEYVGNILYDEKLMDTDMKMVIFGAGTYGKKILQYLELNSLLKNVICFCDSNVKHDKHEVNGIPVYHTTDAIKKFPDADYLVSGKYAKEMYDTLKKEGIEKIHILMV